jgi:hypothetical protein
MQRKLTKLAEINANSNKLTEERNQAVKASGAAPTRAAVRNHFWLAEKINKLERERSRTLDEYECLKAQGKSRIKADKARRGTLLVNSQSDHPCC